MNDADEMAETDVDQVNFQADECAGSLTGASKLLKSTQVLSAILFSHSPFFYSFVIFCAACPPTGHILE